MSDFIWQDDIRVGASDDMDAYTKWVRFHGRRFEATEGIAPKAEADFNFILRVPQKYAGPFAGKLPIRAQGAGPKFVEGICEFDGFDLGNHVQAAGVDAQKLVLVGVMDDAINIAHARFQAESGETRVDYAWVQDGVFDPYAPDVVPYGRQITGGEINTAIQNNAGDAEGQFSELDLTQDQYHPTPLRQRASHGTHVMDVAAGYDPADNAVNRRIAAVQLPLFASQDTSGASLIAAILAGLDYIYTAARVMSRSYELPIPVVLNFSYGFGAGPGNGTHIIERAMRDQAAAYQSFCDTHFGTLAPAVTVVPAGNGHLSQSVARAPQGEDALSVALRLQPEDRSSSYVEIWFPAASKQISVCVTPYGLPTGSLNLCWDEKAADWNGATATILASDDAPDQIIARLDLEAPNPKPKGDQEPYWRVLVAIAPTMTDRDDGMFSPHGAWQITASSDGIAADQIFARVQRDEAPMGFRRQGRQAYFDDPAYNRFDVKTGDLEVGADVDGATVRRDGTVSGIATHSPAKSPNTVISVGAARWDLATATTYSAAGVNGHDAPYLLTAAESSRQLSGVLGAGSQSGSQVALSGTSVAAPQVSRILADILEQTPITSYVEFEAQAALAYKSHTIDVPNADRPEGANSAVVRPTRSQVGYLPISNDRQAQVLRGITPKREEQDGLDQMV